MCVCERAGEGKELSVKMAAGCVIAVFGFAAYSHVRLGQARVASKQLLDLHMDEK